MAEANGPELLDVHAHFVTDEYVGAAIAAGIDQPDGMPAWPSWTVNQQISSMRDNAIRHAVLSLSSPGVSFAGTDAPALARHVNDFAAAAVVIGDHAVLELNLRTYNDSVRTAVLDAIKRIVTAECQASNSPREPEFKLFDRFPLTVNDDAVTDRVSAAFADYFGDRYQQMPAQSASEDFSDIPNALDIPYTYWGFGGTDPQLYEEAAAAGRIAQDVPVNHSATFAPPIQPTLATGTQALVVAALAWL